MTSQKDQIQSLIADIEQVLGASKPRKPWVRVSEVEPQRQALAKAQDYLKSLQQAFDAPGGWGPVDPSTGQVMPSAASGREQDAVVGSGATSKADSGKRIFSGLPVGDRLTEADSSAEDVLQALLTEMKFLRSSALEPLRLEMDSLRAERDDLQQEVKGLAEERSSLAASAHAAVVGANEQAGVTEDQLNQFLAALMERLQERLSVQVTQTLERLESDHADAIAQLSPAADAEVLQLRASDSNQLEEMRQLQSRSDQLLVNIDSTLQSMFKTLQKNIDSYQISLNEGIENMHSLGRQGEVIVRSLVDHLTQQLGQTAPPEPAFFPPRSAAPMQLPLTFMDEPSVDSSKANTSADSDIAIESVSSLNEILPEATSEDSAASTNAFTTPEDSSPHESTNPIDSTTALRPEDCIREDGTIDLDLLKLDIDRNEDDELTADKLMVDAAIADAQVAASEAEDPEIEAKVTPTADAVYLADLTLEDLTVDDRLAVDSLTANEPLLVDTLVNETSTDESLSRSVDDLGPAFQPASETDLADILPSLGETGSDQPSVETTILSADEAKSAVSESIESEPIESVDTENTELETIDLTNVEANETATEVTVPVGMSAAILGAAALGGAAAVRADDDAMPMFKELEAMLQEDAENMPVNAPVAVPDSALSPDVPDDDGGIEDEDLAMVSVDALDAVDGSIDDSVSSDLAVQLEADNQASVQIATSAISRGLSALSEGVQSDLEEPIVSEEDAPLPSPLSEDASPLESGRIPDWPEDLSWDAVEDLPATDQVGPSVVNLPAVPLSEIPTVTPPVVTPPVDFDDDLDFYSTENQVAEDQTAQGQTAQGQTVEDPITEIQTARGSLPADDSADDLLETLSTESFEEDSVAELAANVPSEAQTINDLAGFPELPVIASPIPPSTAVMDESLASEPVDTLVSVAPPNDADNPIKGQPASWFLGLDVGTTGLSAVLINQLGDQVYPLCWSVAGDDQSNRFRLPAVLQLDAQTSVSQGSDRTNIVGPLALQSDQQLRSIKPLLKVGIPNNDTGEPWIQWSDRQSLPLLSLQRALTNLLKMLSPDQTSCQAVGLSDRARRWVLSQLKGVIVGYPSNWPDTYSFNVREAVLAAGIVSQPEQVFFVEEAIATLLSALPDPAVADESLDSQQPGLYNCNWQGSTIVISAGATLTEAAIADLPEDLSQLIYRDFALRSFPYAGDNLDQDIICQLLHPPAQDRLDAIAQSSSPVDENVLTGWQSLGLNRLNLPQTGEADRAKRHRLQQRLNDSPLGREAVMAARNLKQTLQEETQCEITLGDQTWVIKRKDLEAKVFLPYIQRINRQVDTLLSQKGLSAQSVKQVVCTGGSASLGAIARWLRQKFPNATIIQDTYSGEYSNSCSRVAYGLANLCHYPNVLDQNRHQYNDYFLLLELLRVLPEQPLPAGGILHLLEQRGINTQACQAHILALIEGHLPPGLVPTGGDRPMISAQSPNIGIYQTLAELPLFRKQGGQIYIADPQQGARLRAYLEALLATKAQSLSEPQAVNLAVAQNSER